MPDLHAAATTRSRGLCEHCGRPLDSRAALHHRRPGGMGGTKRPGQQELSNVLMLRSDHHENHTAGSVHALGPGFSVYGRQTGWLLSTHVQVPADVPVWYQGNRWVLLNDDGTVTPWEWGDTTEPPV